jgi:hypothetical protein
MATRTQAFVSTPPVISRSDERHQNRMKGAKLVINGWSKFERRTEFNRLDGEQSIG